MGAILGGDIDRAALRAAGPNLRRLGDVFLARWDARALPLGDQSVDRIICNPPFGKQLSRPEAIGPLYRDALREWDRVLRRGGRAIVLVSDLPALKQAAAKVGWTSNPYHQVRVLGQRAFLTTWRKS
jgi:tRNA (guanine6-N2)-methyltransferase